jgi:hypothetical protein
MGSSRAVVVIDPVTIKVQLRSFECQIEGQTLTNHGLTKTNGGKLMSRTIRKKKFLISLCLVYYLTMD